MMILALEFSSTRRSVALVRGQQLLADVSETGESGTNAFGLIEKVLAAAEIGREKIEVVAVGLGPGSYSGIRVALAIAQGWQLAARVKVLGVSSVECLAAQALEGKMFGRVAVVIDAHRGEYYLASFEVSADRSKEVEALKIATRVEVELHANAGDILIGPEVTRWYAAGKSLYPQATTLAKLAAGRQEFDSGGLIKPIYLRDANFLKIPAQQGQKSGGFATF